VDVDGIWSDGCECQDDAFAKSCAGATSLGTIGIGQSTSRTGVLPLASEENWFVVTFNGARTTNSYHPRITVTSAGGDNIRFDILNGCGGSTLNCPNEGGSAAAVTNWEEVSNGLGDPNGIGCGNSTTACNSTCNCTSAYSGMPAVGNNGTVYIRVHRITGSPTCNNYSLSVTD